MWLRSVVPVARGAVLALVRESLTGLRTLGLARTAETNSSSAMARAARRARRGTGISSTSTIRGGSPLPGIERTMVVWPSHTTSTSTAVARLAAAGGTSASRRGSTRAASRSRQSWKWIVPTRHDGAAWADAWEDSANANAKMQSASAARLRRRATVARDERCAFTRPRARELPRAAVPAASVAHRRAPRR